MEVLRRAKQHGEIMGVLQTHKRAFYAIIAFSFVINFLYLTPSIYMLQVYDRVITGRSTYTLLFLSILCFALCGLLVFLDYIRTSILIRLNNAIDEYLSARVFNSMFQANLHRTEEESVGNLNDLQQLRSFITGNGLFGFLDAPWIPIYLIVVFMLHTHLGLLALLGAIVLISLTFLNEKVTKKILKQANLNGQVGNTYAASTLKNADVIQAMGMLSNLRQRWYGYQANVLTYQTVASERAAVISNLSKLTRLLVQSGVLGLGAYLVIMNQATPGIMIAASILVGRALAPVELLIGSWKGFDNARFAYSRLDKLLNAYPPQPANISLPAPHGHLSIQNIFVYAPNTKLNVLKGVSLDAQPGQVIGLIGPTGSGKSTLAKVVVGVLRPFSGKVTLDGAELSQWNREELGRFMGYLPQEVELFSGSVAENISRFESLDSDKIVAAAKQAGVHEMILELPNGYQTQLGVGGNVLSAGQKQRIGLARALYGQPSLVILDEPNSNLDDEGERALLVAIQTLKQQSKTVLVITHRTSILNAIDQLIILNKGVVAAAGPTREVLQKMKAAG